MVDASNVAVGAALKQHLADHVQLLALFSRELSPAKTRYGTFGRELLAVLLTTKHFRHFIECRGFTVFTDHKTFPSLSSPLLTSSTRGEIRQLDYIWQFTSDIRHIDGSHNEVADALSRSSTAHLQLSLGINIAEMAVEQRRVGSPYDEDVSELQFQDLTTAPFYATSPTPPTVLCAAIPPPQSLLLPTQPITPWESSH
nr:unnamed protein product [Spirometra erinaceieuropaei]